MAKPAVKSVPTSRAAPAEEVPEGNVVQSMQVGIVRGSIRRNDSNGVLTHTVICERVWRDSSGQEHTSEVFRSSDLQSLAKVASECRRWIEWQERMHTEGNTKIA
jgi:hypothetical protein